MSWRVGTAVASKAVCRALVGSLLLALISSCVVSPSQIYDIAKSIPTPQKQKQLQQRRSRWVMSFAGGEYFVSPDQSQSDAWVFTGDNGLKIVLDGSEIISLDGLPGGFGPLRVERQGQERLYRRGGGRSFTVRCTTPIEWQLSPIRMGYRTECRGDLNGTEIFIHHSIELDERREPRQISIQIAPGTAPLILRRP
jgi:hypothetical protein